MQLKEFPHSEKVRWRGALASILLTPKNLDEAYKVIDSIFTEDEKLKIGRRLFIYELLESNDNYQEIIENLRTSDKTVSEISIRKRKFPDGFALCLKRYNKLKKQLQPKYKKYRNPLMVAKKVKRVDPKQKEVLR